MVLGRNDPLEKIDYYNTNDRAVNYLNDSPIENSIINDELRWTDDIFEDTKATVKDFLSIVCIIYWN